MSGYCDIWWPMRWSSALLMMAISYSIVSIMRRWRLLNWLPFGCTVRLGSVTVFTCAALLNRVRGFRQEMNRRLWDARLLYFGTVGPEHVLKLMKYEEDGRQTHQLFCHGTISLHLQFQFCTFNIYSNSSNLKGIGVLPRLFRLGARMHLDLACSVGIRRRGTLSAWTDESGAPSGGRDVGWLREAYMRTSTRVTEVPAADIRLGPTLNWPCSNTAPMSDADVSLGAGNLNQQCRWPTSANIGQHSVYYPSGCNCEEP